MPSLGVRSSWFALSILCFGYIKVIPSGRLMFSYVICTIVYRVLSWLMLFLVLEKRPIIQIHYNKIRLFSSMQICGLCFSDGFRILVKIGVHCNNLLI